MVKIIIECDRCRKQTEVGLEDYLHDASSAVTSAAYDFHEDLVLCNGCLGDSEKFKTDQQKQLREFFVKGGQEEYQSGV